MMTRLRFVSAELAAVAVLAVTAAAVYALAAGQDMNWDLRNYHFYAAHALLHGRLGQDIAPGNLPGYLNPLIYLTPWAAISTLPPLAAGAVLGALSGLCAVAVYALALVVTAHRPARERRWLAGVAALCGATGPMFLSEVGTSFADNLSGLMVMLGLLALVRELPVRAAGAGAWRGHVLAGLLLGAATGFKLTNAVFAVALAVALAAVWGRGGTDLRRFLAFAVAGIAGAVLAGGYWAMLLIREFGSPVFPYYNAVFRSPLFEPVNISDPTFLPDSVIDALGYPLAWLAGRHVTAEVAFRDARFALVGLGLILWAVAALWRWRGRGTTSSRTAESPGAGTAAAGAAQPAHRLLLVTFFVVAFALWLGMFAIQRYAVPLELLSGIVLLLACERVAARPRTAAWAFLGLAAFAVLWTRPGDWDRIGYGESWFGVAIPAPMTRPDTLFTVHGTQPSAFLIPFLPESDRFIRITGFVWLDPAAGLGVPAAAAIAGHTGPLRTLSNGPLYPGDHEQIARFGLALAPEPCVEFRTRMDRFQSCALVRASAPGQ